MNLKLVASDTIRTTSIYLWFSILRANKEKSNIFCPGLSEKKIAIFGKEYGIFQHNLTLFNEKTSFFTILMQKMQFLSISEPNFNFYKIGWTDFIKTWIYRIIIAFLWWILTSNEGIMIFFLRKTFQVYPFTSHFGQNQHFVISHTISDKIFGNTA